ncbi:MAG: sulfatase-like hydrolase/transferase, partial [Planctomycetota bacterium]
MTLFHDHRRSASAVIASFVIGIAASAAAVANAADTDAAEPVTVDKPNIVFVLADDQGFGDLGCYGSETIATPNIDSLAKDGIKFTSFYVHNRCSPSRAAFMTGCYADRVGIEKVVYRRDKIGLNTDEITVAE